MQPSFEGMVPHAAPVALKSEAGAGAGASGDGAYESDLEGDGTPMLDASSKTRTTSAVFANHLVAAPAAKAQTTAAWWHRLDCLGWFQQTRSGVEIPSSTTGLVSGKDTGKTF